MFSFLQNQKIVFLILIFAGIIVYANILPNAMFWDDDDFILNNQFVKSFDFGHIFSENIIAGAGFISNYFRPILSTVFAIEWQLFHNWTPGYHAVNVMFHIANGILLFIILKKLFSPALIPFFVSLIFIIHPLQTEAVAYANSLGDSLSVFLMFLALFFYIHEVYEVEPRKIELSTNLRFYGLSLVIFILALLSKESVIVLPIFLALIEFLLYKNWKNKNTILRLVPFFIIAGIYIYLRATAWNFDNTFNFYDKPDAYTESIFVRIWTFFKVLTIYFGLLVLPIKLHYERSIGMSLSFFERETFIGFSILVILFVIALVLFIKRKKPECLFGLLWFLTALAPSSGILIPINNYLYEHWLYLPMIGFFLFVGFLIYETYLSLRIPITTGVRQSQNLSVRLLPPQSGVAMTIIICIFLIFLSVQTIKRNAEWRDPLNFYLQTLEFSPKSGRAWNNLGTEYAKIGKLEEAKNAYLKSIEFIPQNPGPYNNLGNVFAALGELDTAAEYWEKSVAINPDFLPPQKALEQYYAIKKKISAGEKIKIKFNGN